MDAAIKKLLSSYQPSPYALELIRSTPILFLVGTFGAGKSHLKEELLRTGKYHHIVSHTTRSPRINHGVPEQNGREYYFVDMSIMRKMLEKQALVEAKLVHKSNIYGTSVAEIQKAHDEHKIALTDIDVQGVAEYKCFDNNVMAAFLLPPNFEVWQERLLSRYGDSVDLHDVEQRFRTALKELRELRTTDRYAAFINDDQEQTLKQVETYAKTGTLDPRQQRKALDTASKLAEAAKKYLKTIEATQKLN